MSNQPLEIRLTMKLTVLEIDWDDGITTGLTAATLRRYCKCSECVSVNGRGKQSVNKYEGLSVTSIVPLGLNAVNLQFSDGHAEGIFPFSYLRAIAQEDMYPSKAV
jgi:DUF971 family protein